MSPVFLELFKVVQNMKQSIQEVEGPFMKSDFERCTCSVGEKNDVSVTSDEVNLNVLHFPFLMTI